MLNPSFPEADFQRLKAQQLARVQQEAARPVTAALRILPRLLYGEGHAYANPLTGSGTAASVGKLARADVARWHQTWVRPNNATLVVVGDTTAREIVPRLERLLGAWRAAEVPRKNLAQVPPPAAGRVYLLAPHAIPLTHNGKIQHAALRDQYSSGALRASHAILFPDY